MNQSLYEVVALGARYVFAGLMVLIVLRAWRITIVDSRRARTLRRMSPQTGLSGELVVVEGDGKACRGMKYPVIREGMIGSSRRADIRIRHASVRRRHAYFQLTRDGLSIRTHAGAPMRDGRGRAVRALTLPDGGELSIGRVRLLLVLTQAPDLASRPRRERRDVAEDGEAFTDADALFGERPLPRREAGRLTQPDDAEANEWFDVDGDDDAREGW